MFLSHRTRRGLSLTEVLIAIFVMAIGMISLLVLFIVGLQNARAGLDTGRLAMMASNSNAVSESPHWNVQPVNLNGQVIPVIGVDAKGNPSPPYSLRTDQASNLASIKSIWTPVPVGTLPLMASFFTNRNYFLESNPLTWTVSTKWTFATSLNGVGGVPTSATVVYPPVMIDPLVVSNPLWVNTPTGLPYHVGTTSPATNPYLPFDDLTLPQVPSNAALRPMFSGATATLGLPRSTLVYYPSNPLGMSNDTTLPDEINFADQARPFPLPPGPYQNDRRFSVAYLCRWPDLTKPEICDVTQALFTGRPNGRGILTTPPGEVNYIGDIDVSSPPAAGLNGSATDPLALGRLFLKGSTQATVYLGTIANPVQDMAAAKGDWILDNTFILPEYDENNNPFHKAPFLDTYVPTPLAVTYPFPPLPTSTTIPLRAGLSGGYFYKIVDVTEVRLTTNGKRYQVLTLDRPARSDGFVGTMITSVADVIEKGVGRMPAR